MFYVVTILMFFFFFQAEDGIRDWSVTGVQTCALPISLGGIIKSFEEMFTRVLGRSDQADAFKHHLRRKWQRLVRDAHDYDAALWAHAFRGIAGCIPRITGSEKHIGAP